MYSAHDITRSIGASRAPVTVLVVDNDTSVNALELVLDKFRASINGIGILAMQYGDDAQERGERRARDLVALDRRPPPVAPKPVVVRVTGLDIRRFIPRRAI